MDRGHRSTARLVAAAVLVAATMSVAISCKKFGRSSKAPPSVADVVAGATCGKSRPCGPDEIQNDRIDLPDARYADPPVDAPIKIVIDKSRVTIVGDPYPIVQRSDDPARQSVWGDRGQGDEDHYIAPLAQALTGARNAVDAGAGSWDAVQADGFDSKHAVLVIADRKTPYRVFADVLFNAGQSELSSSWVAVRSGGAISVVKLSGHSGIRHYAIVGRKSPHLFDRVTDGEQPVFGKLSVRLAQDGIHVAVDRNVIATGCDRAGQGPAIERVHDAPFDFAALAACAKKIHASLKEPDSDATVSADDDTPLADFLAAIDAIHGAPNEALWDAVFPGMPSGAFP
jgi:hypothetical protein